MARKKRKKRRPVRPSKKPYLRILLMVVLFVLTLAAGVYLLILKPGTVPTPEIVESTSPVPESIHVIEAIKKKQPPPQHQKPRIAIIIDDFGHRTDIAEKFVNSDLAITFAVLPYAGHTREIAEAIHQAGREIMLHLPMEPTNPDWDPGPNALRVGMASERMLAILDQDLQLVPHAIGVNNHMGSRFTEDEPSMLTFLKNLKNRDLLYIDSLTAAKSTGYRLANELGIPAGRRDVFLDNIQDREAITGQLQQLVDIAKKHGSAIGIGHAYPLTLETLQNHKDGLLQEVELVRIKELLL